MESWRIKVHPRQDRTYLWGGEGVTVALTEQVLLTFRVEDEGERVTFGRFDLNSVSTTTMGELKPGEAYTFTLQGIRGVWARCSEAGADTYVQCWLTAHSI